MENTISKFIQSGLQFQHLHSKSVTQIQKELLKSKNKPIANVLKLTATNNTADMKIISPFYPRPVPCKGKHCTCPFHRRMKMQTMLANRPLKNPKCVQTVNNSPKKSNDQQKSLQEKRSYKPFLKQKRIGNLELNLSKQNIYPRIDSYNEQFSQFLKEYDLLLLKKNKYQKIDSHTIKTSVGQIFKYIYTHLDQKKEVVQNHIESLQKDRDFTKFYIEKYIDLKTKYLQCNKAKVESIDKNKLSFHQTNVLRNSNSRFRERSKYSQKKETTRKLTRGKRQKLLMELLIQDVDYGQDLQAAKITDLAHLDIYRFEENCEFLKNKLANMDTDTLQQIRQQIAQKIFKILSALPQNETNLIKRSYIRKIITMINGKLKDKNSSRTSSQQDNKSYISLHKKNSQYKVSPRSTSKRGSICPQPNPPKSGFSPENTRFLNQMSYIEDSDNEAEEEQQQVSQLPDTRRTKQKGNTIHVPDNEYIVRKAKLKLAKYRRLSHDVFFHKLILTEDDDIISSKNDLNQEQIMEKLGVMTMQLSELRIKKKEIQAKIKQHKLHNLLIQDCDSLLTAKRKIGVFKKLLKEDAFTDDMRQKIQQYLVLTQQQVLIKNKNWATKKIKDSFRLDEDNVQIMGEQQQQDKQSLLKGILKQIFRNQLNLIFYDVYSVLYEEPQLNFEQHFITVNTKIQYRERKQKTKTKLMNPLLRKKSPPEIQIPPKQQSLIQVQLKNKGTASCFFDQQCQAQNSFQISRITESMEKQQNKYLSILQKLKGLKK